MQRNEIVKCFYIHGYDDTCVEFKTFLLRNFVETDQNARNSCIRLFLYKINKKIS